MTTEADLGRAIGGLYRVLLEPNGVLDVLDAIDQLGPDGPSDSLLDQLREQFVAASSLLGREQVRPQAQFEVLRLSSARLILSVEGDAGIFSEALERRAPGAALCLRDPQAQDELESALAALAPSEQRFLPINLATGALLTLAVRRAPNGEAARYVITALPPTAWSEAVERSLRSLQLTPAEIRVFRALRGNESLRDLALRIDLSEHTVRTQVKAVFAKLGLARQSELLRFREDIARLSEVTNPPRTVAAAEGARTWPQRRVWRLKSGRDLSYREYGSADDPPVIVLHGAYSGSLIPDAFRPAAGACGVRVIAPDRPGYGRSSPSTREMTVAAAAAEITELAKGLGLQRYAVVALAVAAAFGLELARGNAAVTQLFICSPHFASANIKGGKPELAMMLRYELFRRAPWIAEQVMRGAWEKVTHAQAQRVASEIWKRSPTDYQMIRDTNMDRYFADVTMDALQRPVDGPIWELTALARYRFSLGKIACPITLIFGRDDRVTNVGAMTSLFGKAQVREIEGAGHLFFLTRWPDVLDWARQSLAA